MKKKTLFGVLLCCLLLSSLFVIPTKASAEVEIGRSNVGEWNGAVFYEYVTKEFLSENNTNDTVTYRIRYHFKHSGAYYAYQTYPVGLYVDGKHVASFADHVNEHVVNQDRVHGTYDITLSKGVNHTVQIKDMVAGSPTQVNVTGTIFHALPTYTVTFLDGFGNTINSQSVTKYQDAVLPQAPNKEGYTFTGWSGKYTDITSAQTVTATWSINQYTVSFETGTPDVIASQTVNYGQKVAQPKEIEKYGYTFLGWYNSATNTLWDFTNDVVKNEMTLKAEWKINEYNVTFDSMNGNAPTVQTITHGSKVMPPQDPIKEGHTFLGWFVKGSDKKWNFDKNEVTSNLQLEAHWKINEYEVSFDADNGEEVFRQTVTFNEKVNEPDEVKKSGFIFEGWYVKGVDKKWDFDNDVVKEKVKLIARWREIEKEDKTVSIHWNDESDKMSARPKEVEVRVNRQLENGEKKTYETITLTGKDDAWSYALKDIPKTDEYAKEYAYTIELLTEDKNYTFTIHDFSIDATLNTIDVNGEILWHIANDIDIKPEEIQVSLYQDNESYEEQVVTGKKEDDIWQYEFDHLLVYEPNTQESYEYTVNTTVNHDDFTVEVTDYTIAIDFENPMLEMVGEVEVVKPEEVELPTFNLQVLQDNEIFKTIELKEEEFIVEDLPKYANDGHLFEYDVQSEEKEDWKVEITKGDEMNYKVRIEYIASKEVGGIKTGDDSHTLAYAMLLTTSCSLIGLFTFWKKKRREK